MAINWDNLGKTINKAVQKTQSPVGINISGSGGVGSVPRALNVGGSAGIGSGNTSTQTAAQAQAAIPTPAMPAWQAPKAPDVRDMFRQILSGWGFQGGDVESMLSKINEWQTVNGWDASTIEANIPSLESYQKRFPANKTRTAAGLPALSPQEYFAQEEGYRKALRANGLPANLYDSNDDFASWIANDISVDEINARATVASTWANNVDPSYRKALKDYYGIEGAEVIAAYALGGERAISVLERQSKAIEIGAAAVQNQLGIGRGYAEELVGSGIGGDQARAAFADVAAEKDDLSKLATIDGQSLSTKELVDADLNLDAAAQEKKKGLKSNERARFSGQGAGLNALTSNTSGAV